MNFARFMRSHLVHSRFLSFTRPIRRRNAQFTRKQRENSNYRQINIGQTCKYVARTMFTVACVHHLYFSNALASIRIPKLARVERCTWHSKFVGLGKNKKEIPMAQTRVRCCASENNLSELSGKTRTPTLRQLHHPDDRLGNNKYGMTYKWRHAPTSRLFPVKRHNFIMAVARLRYRLKLIRRRAYTRKRAENRKLNSKWLHCYTQINPFEIRFLCTSFTNYK